MAAKPSDVVDINFPKIEESYVKDVNKYTVQQINLLTEGLTKDQVRHILGNPSFNEGIFNVRTWNYILDIQTSDLNIFKRCQLRIDFDKNVLASEYYWKGDNCLEKRKDSNIQEQVVVKNSVSAVTQVDIFFRFDSSDLNTAMSNMKLSNIVNAIKQSGSKKVLLRGYADPMGSMNYNQRLSERRTNALVNYLVSSGINPSFILMDAKGATEQYKACSTENIPESRKDCLAPNRRVNISW